MTLALQSYLLGFAFWVSVVLGALALAMLHQLVGGRWGAHIRPALSAILQTLPLFALLVLPLLLGLDALYPWSLQHDAVLDHKRPYLNAPFFAARSIGYVLTWSLLALPLSGKGQQRRRAGIGLILLFLTGTFAAIDWMQSLEPHWHSTVYGLIFLGASVVAATAFTVVVSAKRGDAQALGDLGNMLLASIMLLAYFSLSQLIVIWSGNLADENGWYIARARPGWLVLAAVCACVVVPFVLLLNRQIKSDPKKLRLVALLSMAGAAVHLFWFVAPAFHRQQLWQWTDAVGFFGVGALWLLVFLWRLRAQA
jgi:hypothetical protein